MMVLTVRIHVHFTQVFPKITLVQTFSCDSKTKNWWYWILMGRSYNRCFDYSVTIMWNLCVKDNAIPLTSSYWKVEMGFLTYALLCRKVDVGFLTCTADFVRCVHRKMRWALTCIDFERAENLNLWKTVERPEIYEKSRKVASSLTQELNPCHLITLQALTNRPWTHSPSTATGVFNFYTPFIPSPTVEVLIRQV